MIICFLLNYNPGLTVIIAQSNPSEDLLLNTAISIIFSHTSTAAPCHFINLFSNKYFRNGFSILSIITDNSFLIDILRCVSSETMGTDERKITATYSILKDNLVVWLPITGAMSQAPLHSTFAAQLSPTFKSNWQNNPVGTGGQECYTTTNLSHLLKPSGLPRRKGTLTMRSTPMECSAWGTAVCLLDSVRIRGAKRWWGWKVPLEVSDQTEAGCSGLCPAELWGSPRMKTPLGSLPGQPVAGSGCPPSPPFSTTCLKSRLWFLDDFKSAGKKKYQTSTVF